MLLLACASNQRTKPPPADVDSTAASESASVDQALLRQLAEQVAVLESSASAASQERLIATFRLLAKVSDALAGQRGNAFKQINDAADEMASVQSDPGVQTRAAEKALAATSRVLFRRTPPRDGLVVYEATLRALDNAASQIAGHTPLNVVALAKALREATNAAFIATGVAPPFASRVQQEGPRRLPGGQGDFQQNVQQARVSVGELAKLSWSQVSAAAAATLSLLAEALQSDTTSADGGRSREVVAELRFQAERLRRAESLGFGQAGWVKAGLSAALNGIELLDVGREASVRSWLEVARRATSAIDERGGFAFQRALVQDAFRTVVDAFVVAARPARASQSP